MKIYSTNVNRGQYIDEKPGEEGWRVDWSRFDKSNRLKWSGSVPRRIPALAATSSSRRAERRMQAYALGFFELRYQLPSSRRIPALTEMGSTRRGGGSEGANSFGPRGHSFE